MRVFRDEGKGVLQRAVMGERAGYSRAYAIRQDPPTSVVSMFCANLGSLRCEGQIG